MPDKSRPATAEALLALLHSEAEALLEGKIDRVIEGVEEKDALLARLQSEPRIAPEMRSEIISAAERNGRLLRAASDGLQAAIRRLDDMRDLRDGKTTYGADGGRQGRGGTPGRVEKRV